MGFGSSFKKAAGGILGSIPGGESLAATGALDTLGIGESIEDFNARRKAKGLSTISTPEQLTAMNVFKNLSREQQKDLLINNPNIETALGSQFFDPSTNTIRLEESPFTESQRLRQESLASALSSSLSGNLPGVDAEARFEEGRQLFQRDFDEQRDRLKQELADQGIPAGSEAYNQEFNRLEGQQNRQLRELQRESVATVEAQRAARFNEIASLLNTQQVGGIGFNQFQPRASGLDLFGAEQAGLNRAFQADQARKDRREQRNAALIGALGSTGSSAIAAAFSDIRLKENIEQVGVSPSGIPIFEFEYKDKKYGEFRYEGVMAQDVEEINPDAVITLENGTKAVIYAMIDADFRRVQ